jgi:hypothetical protein
MSFERKQLSQQNIVFYYSITEQLQEKGYVEANHLLVGQDIDQICNAYLQGVPGISHTKTADMNDSNANVRTFLDTLKQCPSGISLIPASTGRHYVLIVVDDKESEATITCWDPLPQSDSNEIKDSRLKILRDAAKEVYPSKKVTVNYEYGNEQNDSFTCGYRIVRKAFELAGIDNELTRCKPDNANAICNSFIKLLAKKDPVLKDHELGVIEDSSSSLVFSKTFEQTNQDTSNSVDFQNVVGRKQQIADDEKLATALQEIYCNNPEIASDEAFRRAKANAIKLTPQEVFQKQAEIRKKLATWQSTFFEHKKLPASCGQEALIEETPVKLIK